MVDVRILVDATGADAVTFVVIIAVKVLAFWAAAKIELGEILSIRPCVHKCLHPFISPYVHHCTGPPTYQADPQIPLAGPQIPLAGPQTPLAASQTSLAGP